MKKSLSILLSTALAIAATESCSKMDEMQNQIDRQGERISAVPSGIVMLTQNIEERHKGEEAVIDIIVNPSDYQLKLEQLDLLCSHDIYTCYTDKDGRNSTPKFDESVSSDFRVAQLQKAEGVKGGYQVTIEIDGSGNYYDSSDVYLLVKGSNSNGEEIRVCSATPCNITVIPTIKEGLFVDDPVQSMFVTQTVSRAITAGRE